MTTLKHLVQAQAESALIVKRFAFQFVNQFSALLYAAFWLRDLQRVRSLLVMAFVTHVVGTGFKLGIILAFV
jgi:hypothetical protein